MEFISAPHRILSIDPGKSGAVCVLGQGKFEVRRDFKTLQHIARAIRDLSEGVTHIVMEFVHAMPGQGVCSMFSFGRAAGVADGAFEVCLPGLVVEQVTPMKWQSYFRDKLNIPRPLEFSSTAVAGKIFPNSLPYLKRKLDHGTADAILLGIWKHFSLSGT